jgi:hypothetical protein
MRHMHKTITIITSLLALCLLLVGTVQAQFPPVPGDSSDEAEAVEPFEMPVLDQLTGQMIQTSPTGALIEQPNGLYVLALENADTTTAWRYSQPSSAQGTVQTRAVSRGWREQKGLRGQGTLTAEGLELRLILLTPFLNPETGILSYTVLVTEIIQPRTDDPTSVLLNRTFDSPMQLEVDLNTQFLDLLVEGVNASVANQRDCTCPPGTPGFLCEICESGGI